MQGMVILEVAAGGVVVGRAPGLEHRRRRLPASVRGQGRGFTSSSRRRCASTVRARAARASRWSIRLRLRAR